MTEPSRTRPQGPPVKAAHGYRNEVSWRNGAGRQPYANQGEEARQPESGGREFVEGDRGAHSGENLAQLEQIKRMP